MSQEIMKSELDLFKQVSFQGSIESSQLIRYRPINVIADSQTVEFDIPIGSDEYLDLQNVYIWVKGQVVQRDGTDFPAAQDDRYGLITYGVNTIFDQLDITCQIHS